MQDIKDFTPEELKKEISGTGLPGYTAGQILDWAYKKGVCDFDRMTNLSKAAKERLKEGYRISGLKPDRRLESRDGTEKFLFALTDGERIETVLIPSGRRNTVCLSTQAGCKYKCAFCASGKNGFIRDLAPSEITNQILYLRHALKKEITNCVFMGMGEPLDNFNNVSKAILIMNDPEAMKIGARKITVSTCGIIPGIKRLAGLDLQINLSVSLHAANDKLRNELLPVNKKYPLKALIRECLDFADKTGRKLTLEYVLIKGKNDSFKDADELAKIARQLRAKINLIPYSEVKGFDYKVPSKSDADKFTKRLAAKGPDVTLRDSKGADIQAACGQLAG